MNPSLKFIWFYNEQNFNGPKTESGRILSSDMVWLVVFGFLIIQLVNGAQTTNNVSRQSMNDIERCRVMYKEDQLKSDSALPEFPTGIGLGWDNLQNIPRSQIFNFTYDQCKLTPDLEYLVADGLDVILVKKSQVDRMANYYDSFSSYRDSTSFSINLDESVGISYVSVSGSLSAEVQDVKQRSVGEKSSILRSKIEHHAYTALVQTGTHLDATFKQSLMQIAEALLKNSTKLAQYLSQMVVRDYGTHVVTNVDVGARIIQEDFVDSKSMSTSQDKVKEFRAAAAASLFNVASVRISIGVNVSSETTSTYQTMLRHSKFSSSGGPQINRVLAGGSGPLTIDDLVVLDRSGVPIYFLASEEYLPELPLPTVATLQSYLRNATDEYYKRNTIFGCQDPDAENFNYNANVNDSSCRIGYNKTSFGGVFQTCRVTNGPESRCNGLEVKNGITGQFKCPTLPTTFQQKKLFQTLHTFPPRKNAYCDTRCHSCGFLWLKTCCQTTCHDVFYVDEVSLEAYWCSADEPSSQFSGYSFGGLFTSKSPNPFSSNGKCGGQYEPLKIGIDLNICVNRGPYAQDSVTFGGFFTSQSSNERCPSGYSQHLAEIIDGCEIYYCVRPVASINVKQVHVKMPPFINFPYEYEAHSLLQSYQDGRMWHRNSETNKSWAMTVVLQENGRMPDHQKMLTEWNKQVNKMQGYDGVNAGLIAGIVVGFLAILILIAAVAFLFKKLRHPVRSEYQPIDS